MGVISLECDNLFATWRDQARWLLGVTVHDDAEAIRTRHRKLIAENHPDTGGSPERAAQLNKARDLLLDELNANPR